MFSLSVLVMLGVEIDVEKIMDYRSKKLITNSVRIEEFLAAHCPQSGAASINGLVGALPL